MDILLLHALANKQRYRTLKHVVPTGMISPDTQVILAWYDAYYNAFPERDFIVVDELVSLIRLRAASASPDALAVTLRLAESLRRPVDEIAMRGILGQLHELDLSGRAGALIAKYNNASEFDSSIIVYVL